MKRVRIRISGVVQGVGFRFCCRREALALGVRGWVRNRLDGSVEAVAEGAVGAVDRFVDWCRTGPRGARVTGVEAVDEPDAGGFEAFEIVP
ncbi:MAG: acylphosphatase [Lentisphaerae bacterium]|nr:acylphosphatase [Lentisphaerota bacterium]